MLANDLPTTLARLGLATILGLALGFERERQGHDAGLRTHGLVSLSSSMLTLSAIELVEEQGEGDPVRVVQGLAQAIGFIAGGLIFVKGGDVRNMTTAASLWMAAAVGITAGAGQYVLVLAGTLLALLLLSSVLLSNDTCPWRARKKRRLARMKSRCQTVGAPLGNPSERQMTRKDKKPATKCLLAKPPTWFHICQLREAGIVTRFDPFRPFSNKILLPGSGRLANLRLASNSY